MKTAQQIKNELKNVKGDEAETSGDDKLVAQGWAEALAWVLSKS